MNIRVFKALKCTAPPAPTSRGRRSTCSPTCSEFAPIGHAAGVPSPQTHPRCPGKQMRESIHGGWICQRTESAALSLNQVRDKAICGWKPLNFSLEGDLTHSPPKASLLSTQQSLSCSGNFPLSTPSRETWLDTSSALPLLSPLRKDSPGAPADTALPACQTCPQHTRPS